MFIDEKQLLVRAGKGGDGAILFRREKYVPRGGPDGGDGGRGGDIVIEARHNLHALAHLRSVRKILAEDGMKGGHRTSTGKSGDDTTILVPLGTQIYMGEVLLVEMVEDKQQHVLCRGGNGGWGNWRFRSSVQQAPDRANPGLPGEEKEIRMVLKLIADVGLIGLPNAGKSTLLSVISKAEPKIANYPFTTLEPQLGVATIGKGADERQVVVADLPGLIEGAADGKGLGVKFLKHVERTKRLVHCIDASSGDPELIAQVYETVRAELAKFSPVLAAKDELICFTKAEMVPEEFRGDLQKLYPNALFISAVTGEGMQQFIGRLADLVS
jgi:GTP-binding protein